jgi:hypothetical protein
MNKDIFTSKFNKDILRELQKALEYYAEIAKVENNETKA